MLDFSPGCSPSDDPNWSSILIKVNVLVDPTASGYCTVSVVASTDDYGQSFLAAPGSSSESEPYPIALEGPGVSDYAISGRVTLNGTNKGVPGVVMHLKYPDGSVNFSQTTDSDGNYSYNVSTTGTYQLTSSFSGPTLYWINSSTVVFLVNASVEENFTANPKTTVFLVPGLGNSSGDMQVLAGELIATDGTGLDVTRFFVDAGFDYRRCAQGGSSCNTVNNVAVPITNPAYCSVANGGLSLAKYIQTWAPPGFPNQSGPPGGIVLIGYSMGGLMARDVIAKGELAGGPSIAELITLGTPNLGYPFQIADAEIFCPQLVEDMSGSWFTGTSSPTQPSVFLTALATNWPIASYGSYWMAAAGQACRIPNRFGDPAIGCPVSNTNSDCVVCASSAAYQGTVSGQSPGPAPSTPGITPWQDTQFIYAHTLTGNGWGTITVLGASPSGAIPIYQPRLGSTLLQSITAVINGY